MSRDLDDTKRNIGAERLGEDERKRLAQQFKDKGGKVLSDAQVQRQTMYDKDKQKENLAKAAGRKEPGRRGVGTHTAIEGLPARKAEEERLGARIGLFWEHVKLYIRSMVQGVMESSGQYLSPKLFAALNADGQNRLLDLELLLAPLAHAAPELRGRLRLALAQLGAWHYELVLRMEKLYNERELREILYRYSVNQSARVTPLSIGEPLRELYKRFYALRSHVGGCRAALVRALEVQGEIDTKDRAAAKRNIERGKKDIDYLFENLMPRLHLAVCNITRRNWRPGDKALEAFLDLKPEDEVGYLTEQLAKEAPKAPKAGPVKADPMAARAIQVSTLPEHVRSGLLLLREVPTDPGLASRGRDNVYRFLDPADKMFLTQVFFDELEREYLCLLTTNQLKLGVEYRDGKKIDTRADLSDLFIEFNHVRESLEEYNKSNAQYHELERAPQLTLMQKSRQLQDLSLVLNRSGKQAREKLGGVLSRCESALRRLLADYNDEKRVLQNAEEPLQFDSTLEAGKKLEGMPALDAIVRVYFYVAAFRHRMQEGDLAGYDSRVTLYYQFDEPAPEETEPGMDTAQF